ncbi:MAG TPA: hypothetical protein VHK69_11445 [Chitinophagaceae bacterium]|jgi:hypothetical protein|nr:hypothetical protein [Chitinophagaceae bacterium]
MYYPDFVHRSTEEQYRILYQAGVCLGTRYEGRRRLLLYQICGFYAEVVYHPYDQQLEGIRCFEDTELLEPYLEEIAIGDLLENRNP